MIFDTLFHSIYFPLKRIISTLETASNSKIGIYFQMKEQNNEGTLPSTTVDSEKHINCPIVCKYPNSPIYPFYRPPFDENKASPDSSGTYSCISCFENYIL